jgi:hypothetical protein
MEHHCYASKELCHSPVIPNVRNDQANIAVEEFLEVLASSVDQVVYYKDFFALDRELAHQF